MVSSIDCWDREDGTDVENRVAERLLGRRPDGLRPNKHPDGSLYSVANMLDIVGHEDVPRRHRQHFAPRIPHPGRRARAESFSDIFGVMIGNWGQAARCLDLADTARASRDPARRFATCAIRRFTTQPKHMRDFEIDTALYTTSATTMGTSTTTAAFTAMSRVQDHDGPRPREKYLFTPAELAAMFYIAVTLQLSRIAVHGLARRAVLQAARCAIPRRGDSKKSAKVAAVERGFDAAGITRATEAWEQNNGTLECGSWTFHITTR